MMYFFLGVFVGILLMSISWFISQRLPLFHGPSVGDLARQLRKIEKADRNFWPVITLSDGRVIEHPDQL